ncbi:MAG: glycosyltransferase [Bacteroidota bacterium]
MPAMIEVLCVGAFLLQVGYLTWLLVGTPAYPTTFTGKGDAKETATGPTVPPITVIVALRNEQDQLPALAQALRAQTHPSVHIVWINDHSTDGTARWLDTEAAPHPREQVVHHSGPPGKKHALDAGIQAAPTKLLAFTDADCTPPPHWLAVLAQCHMHTEQDTVLIGASLLTAPRGVLQRLAGYETWTANIAMLAAAQHGAAYMAVGRNLSYSTSVFERVGRHQAHAHLLSGDDDLFVQAARNVGVPCQPVWHTGAHVPTNPPNSWHRWLRGQRRHTSAGRAYATRPALHLTAYYGSALLVWGAPLLIGTTGAGLLALRLLGVLHLLERGQAALGVKAPMLLAPLWDAAHTVLRIGTAAVGLVAPPAKWT